MPENLPKSIPLLAFEPEVPMPPEAKAIAPEIEPLWDRQIDTEFARLSVLDQRVLTHWIKNGCRNMSAAFRAVVPGITDEAAHASSALFFKRKAVRLFIERMKGFGAEDFFQARETLVEALRASKGVYSKNLMGETKKVAEEPDWNSRIKAAEVLNKMHGNNAPEKHKIEAEIKSFVVEVQLPPMDPDV